MPIKTYTKAQLQSNPGMEVSKYLTLKDIYLNTSLSSIKVDTGLLAALDKFRDHFGKPVRFATKNSLYRTTASNTAAGGAKGSKHLQGIAADFYIEGVTPVELARYAEKIGMGGIGVYSANSRHIHMDTRPGRTCWWIKTSQSNTPGFGYDTTYKQGHRSPAIKDAQAKLNALGFDSGKPDGTFGKNTFSAVKAFQKAKGLSADGVIGKKTWTALGFGA